MEQNLIIDPIGNFPTACKMFEPADYFCENIANLKETDIGYFCKGNSDTTREDIFQKYKIVSLDINNLKKEYDKIIIPYAVNSIADLGTSVWDPLYNNPIDQRIPVKNYFKYLAGKIEKIKYNHLIFLDYNDRAVVSDGENWLKENFVSYSAIFKREYRRTHVYDYSKKVHPFPFLMFGNRPKNSCWRLFEERTLGNSGVNECVWPGDGYNYTPPGKRDEWCGRKVLLEKLSPYITNTYAQGEEFLKLFNTFKFFLHMNGSGHLCKRFYEGLSRDSLMMLEEMDIVFPFKDFFSSKCVFKYPKEFALKLEELKATPSQYKDCKDRQEYIVNTYFNNKWIHNYVDGVLG